MKIMGVKHEEYKLPDLAWQRMYELSQMKISFTNKKYWADPYLLAKLGKRFRNYPALNFRVDDGKIRADGKLVFDSRYVWEAWKAEKPKNVPGLREAFERGGEEEYEEVLENYLIDHVAFYMVRIDAEVLKDATKAYGFVLFPYIPMTIYQTEGSGEYWVVAQKVGRLFHPEQKILDKVSTAYPKLYMKYMAKIGYAVWVCGHIDGLVSAMKLVIKEAGWDRIKVAVKSGEIDWRPTETIPEDYYAL